MAAEQLLSAFPSSPTAALRLTPPFAAGRRRKRELGCQLAWELSCELQGCSWPACREPQTQTPVGWRLAERHKPTCPGPLGSDLGTWPHLETEPPTTAGGAGGAAEWLAVRRAAPLPQSNPPQHLVPGQTLPRWQGPRQVSARASPAPPALHGLDLAAGSQPVAWMPLGPATPSGGNSGFYFWFYFYLRSPSQGQRTCPPPAPCGASPLTPRLGDGSPFSSSPLFLPWAPPSKSGGGSAGACAPFTPAPYQGLGLGFRPGEAPARTRAGGGALATCFLGPGWGRLSELSLTPHTWSAAPCLGRRHWPGCSCPREGPRKEPGRLGPVGGCCSQTWSRRGLAGPHPPRVPRAGSMHLSPFPLGSGWQGRLSTWSRGWRKKLVPLARP